MRVQKAYIHNKELLNIVNLSLGQHIAQVLYAQSDKRWHEIPEHSLTLDRKTGLIWGNTIYEKEMPPNIPGAPPWRLPTHEEVVELLTDRTFSLISTRYYHISSVSTIKTSSGGIWLDRDFPKIAESGRYFPCFSAQEALDFSLSTYLMEKSHHIARLPKMERVDLDDQNKGHFDLMLQQAPNEEYTEIQLNTTLESTDLEEVLRTRDVIAIDFGTSSTVVAKQNEYEEITLQRIGVEDWSQRASAKDYENPTSLQFIQEQGVNVWKSIPHRAPVYWNSVQCAHAVRSKMRDLVSMHDIAGIIPHLKIWAQNSKELRVRMSSGTEFKIPPIGTQVFTPGTPITLSEDYPIDPIELYAWNIGMVLNSHQNGLFPRYVLTFPVQYPQETRDKMRASISRGLARSMPAHFWTSDHASSFSVTEQLNEPAAYAIAALRAYELDDIPEGSDEKRFFAVFDFGGGTTDFAFGAWRLATAQERGYEYALEQRIPSGDVDLGGEKILWSLAYQVYEQNIDIMRESNIVFYPPPHEKELIGVETLLNSGSSARSNSTMMMEKFRSIWERDESYHAGDFSANETISMHLLDGAGTQKAVQLTLDIPALELKIIERINSGVNAFIQAIHQAFRQDAPEKVIIFLAGNATRSPIVSSLFGLPVDEKDQALQERINELAPHTPQERLNQMWSDTPTLEFPTLPEDVEESFSCKTGVAMGLLHLLDGSTKVYPAVQAGKPPFQYFVGTKKRRSFVPIIEQDTEYDVWYRFGETNDSGAFILHASTSPESRIPEGGKGLKLPNPKVASHRITIPPESHFLFIKPIDQNTIAYGISESEDQEPDTILGTLSLG